MKEGTVLNFASQKYLHFHVYLVNENEINGVRLKILIIDDSNYFRRMMEAFLLTEFPDAEVELYEIEKLGIPADDFPWESYDVLILDYYLGSDFTGLDLLQKYRGIDTFPATIVVTGEGSEYVAAKSIKFGAHDYINKKEIKNRSIRNIITDAIESKNNRTNFNNEAKEILDKSVTKNTTFDNALSIGYRLTRLIGKGGFSRVYLGERIEDGNTVVIKILDLRNVSDQVVIFRFMQEAECMKSVESPYVVKIYDYGLSDLYGYITMEFFSRGDLKERIKFGIHPELVMYNLYHIASGLSEIHKKGIIHRDLKPANIMFRGDDSLAIADFGISKIINSNMITTIEGEVLGTPHYICPEQAAGKQVDFTCDLYGLGIIFYEMLTGNKPYLADSTFGILNKHMNEEIPRLTGAVQMYQPVLDKLMAKDREDRFQSADALIDALKDYT